MEKRFATAINCMDGRVQSPVIDYLKATYHVDYVDMITEPGPNRILSDNIDRVAVNSIRKRVEISVLKHGSRAIFVIGHHDCAGNPADEDEQKTEISNSISLIEKWGLPVEVVGGLWVDKDFQVSTI